MAALDFPANPTAGQVYEGDNGVIYTYVGTAPNGHWSAFAELSSESFADIFVEVAGDNMTGDLTLGTDKITLNAADGSITADGIITSNTRLITGGNPNGGTADGCRFDHMGSAKFSRSAGASAVIECYTTGDTEAKIALNADGSAEFNGGTGLAVSPTGLASFRGYSGGNFQTQTSEIRTDGTVKVGGLLPSAPNITLNADGSATFKGQIGVGRSPGAASMAYIKPSGGAVENGIVVQAESPINTSSASISGVYDGTTNFTIRHDGSASFAGDVFSGNYDSSSVPTTNGVRINSAGLLHISTSQNSNSPVITINKTGQGRTFQVAADGTTYIGGTLPSAPNITLNADGTILSGTYQNGSNYFRYAPTDGIRIRAMNKTEPIFKGYGTNNTEDIHILNDGTVEIGPDIGTTRAPNIKLNAADGNITATGNITSATFDSSSDTGKGYKLFSAGQIECQRPATGLPGEVQPAFRGYQGNKVTSVIYSDGTAHFGGTLPSAPNIRLYENGQVDGKRGTFISSTPLGNVSFITGNSTYGAAYNLATSSFNIGALADIQSGTAGSSAITFDPTDGSAEFAEGRIELREVGQVWVYYPTTSPGGTLFQGKSDNGSIGKVVFQVLTNGEVRSDGKILTRNVELQLEADDDTKYTATTDADGEQTLVYNGAVLDVKERLQKTDAALTALKSAAAAASDFAALKSAIATALADI